MKVYRSAADVPVIGGAGSSSAPHGYAATLGNFDGVHLGHQKVLSSLVELASQRGLASLAVTFDPHPAHVHRPESAPLLITGLDEKLRRLEATGVDAVLVQPYTWEFARQTPREFIEGYLAEDLSVRSILVGRDIRFGRGNAGDFETLREIGALSGIDPIVAIDDFTAAQHRVSSTRIRSALLDGDVAAATELLGTYHVVSGEVVHGNARGREMGFPTANIGGRVDGIIPVDGVYAGWVTFADERRLPGAISVGSNPTFEGDDRRVEVHVVGVEFPDMNVYGENARVQFVERIRGQVAFVGMDELIRQIRDDVARVSAVLN